MNLIDGRRVADGILAELRERVEALVECGVTPTLGILLVGNDPRSAVYVQSKRRAAEQLGVNVIFEKREQATKDDVLNQIETWNQNSNVHGMIIQLPLPNELANDELSFIEAVEPTKDVDGLHPLNLGRLLRGQPLVEPATPRGVVALLDEYKVELQGATVTLVGFGKLVGRALSALLIDRGCTLTIATKFTKDLGSVTKNADIIISAAGSPHLIKPDMVKDEVVLIDVGLSELDERIVGDIAPETREKAKLVTPVPGGVGPMTVAMLLTNVVESAERLSEVKRT